MPIDFRSMMSDTSPPSPMELAERRELLRNRLSDYGLSGLFLEGGATLRYFSGIDWHLSERPFGLLLTNSGPAAVLCPAFEERRAAERLEAFDTLMILPWQEHEDPFSKLTDWWLKHSRDPRPLACGSTTRYFVLEGLRKAIAPNGLVSGAPVVNSCRGRKSALEIERMRLANQITQRAIAHGLAHLRSGMTQNDLSRLIQDAHVALGAPPGWALVLFGENAAYPHGKDDGHGLRPGEVVLTDCGTDVFGYQSDVTRTTVFGNPSDRQRQVWDVVDRAQQAAFAAARPGIACQEIDRAARSVIDDAGFGPGYRTFSHRLGHGIGLEGHEWPCLVEGSEIILEPGMTFSNEPGIYLPGEFGVRLETIIHITEDSCEYLGCRQDRLEGPFCE